jgi:hypothetical protein
MARDAESQVRIVWRQAMLKWYHTEHAVDDAGCERLSAAIQSIKDLGVRVHAETRYYGWRKMAAYFIPQHTEEERKAIQDKMLDSELDRYFTLVNTLGKSHPMAGKGLPSLSGTNEPTEESPRTETVHESALQMMQAAWVTARAFRIRHQTSGLSASVTALGKQGVVVDRVWRYPVEGNGYKEFHVFTCSLAREAFLAGVAERTKHERDAARAAAAARAAQRRADRPKAPPKKHRGFLRALDDARMSFFGAPHAGDAVWEAAAESRLDYAARVARANGAVKESPEDIIVQARLKNPKRTAVAAPTAAGVRQTAVDSQMERADLLELGVRRAEDEVGKVKLRLQKAKTVAARIRLREELAASELNLYEARQRVKACGIAGLSDDELLWGRVDAAHPGAFAKTVVVFEGVQYRREFERVLDSQGKPLLRGGKSVWAGRWERVVLEPSS